MLCEKCKKEIKEDKWLKIPELKIEVEIEIHDRNKSWEDLKLNKRKDDLLTAEECIFLANNEKYNKILKMDGSSNNDDFFIQQPLNINRKNGLVAGFGAGSGWVCLIYSRNPRSSSSALGVRFKRKIKGL